MEVVEYDGLYHPLQKILMQDLAQFIERVGANKFHGGDWPDLADIAVFAALTCRDNSKFWREFKEHSFKGRLKVWYIDMQRTCGYKDTDKVVITLRESLVEF